MASAAKKSRITFTKEEESILLQLVEQNSSVIHNNATNGSQPQIKRETWNRITQSFNAATQGPDKSTETLVTKYKNMKATHKKTLSANKKEIMKTGGGTADQMEVNPFGFVPEQIVGLKNPYDNDINVQEETSEVVEQQLERDEDVVVIQPNTFAVVATPKTSGEILSRIQNQSQTVNTQKRLNDFKELIIKLKKENLELQNEKLRLEIIKLKKEINLEEEV